MVYDKNSDISKLVEGCKQGDDIAFSELVNRYTPLIYKLISESGIDFMVTEELFSESCVALHRAALGYNLDQDSVTFGVYAKTCIYHHLVDLKRRNRQQPEFLDCDVEEVVCEDNPDERLVARERLDSLFLYAKESLSDYEYSVLLYHIQGYKTAAIAERLGRSAKSVDNAKARVFRRLRQIADNI